MLWIMLTSVKKIMLTTVDNAVDNAHISKKMLTTVGNAVDNAHISKKNAHNCG